MLNRMRASLLTLALGGLLAACGQSGEAPVPPEKSADAADAADTAQPEVPAPAPSQAASAEAVPVQPADNLWTSAPLSVRTTLANLRPVPNRHNQFYVATTVRFENASDKPIALALADDALNLQLDNGIQARSGSSGISVFRPCYASLQECTANSRDRFVDIDPRSSLDVNVSFNGDYNDASAAELKSVTKSVMNFRLYLLDPAMGNRTLNISLSNVPVTNRFE